MVNSSKAKGSAWERAVVGYLNDHGFPFAERRFGAGQSKDCGDVNGLQLVVECKALREITLASVMDETETEVGHSKFERGMAVIKRRNKPTSEAYCVVPLKWMVEILKDAGY